MQAAIVAVKVVGTALAAKSMVEGIKEGNLLQAVVGAVGAYYGVTSLGSMASAASATSGAGAQAGVQEGAKDLAVEAGADASKSLADAIPQTAESGLTENSGFLFDEGGNLVTETFKDNVNQHFLANGSNNGMISEAISKGAASGTGASSGANFLKTAGNFIKDNKELVGTGLQVGGGLISAYGQKKQYEDMLKEQEAARRRRGGLPSDYQGISYNRDTRRMETR